MKARTIQQSILMIALTAGMAVSAQAATHDLDAQSFDRLAINQSVVLGLSEARQALREQRQDWLQTSLNGEMAQQDWYISDPAMRIAGNPMAARLASGLVIYIGNR
ncbi:hypothetical protein J2T60_002365 [Natronospira proteinivora]|uniref:Uncharacterized protein n=1 Tax=Natronospira proteinivora TaxID=1807133 RepID=A0ABT1GBQ9_9GAMM|nr:hypothetical protein [Natronospira proteinivora]MCP1728365.1 hypothetical protein [Natronospira proteinivora]